MWLQFIAHQNKELLETQREHLRLFNVSESNFHHAHIFCITSNSESRGGLIFEPVTSGSPLSHLFVHLLLYCCICVQIKKDLKNVCPRSPLTSRHTQIQT